MRPCVWSAAVLLLCVGLLSCGAETAILVEVNVDGWQADLIHLEVNGEAGAVIGRNFEVQPSQPRAVIELLPGELFANSFTVVVFVYSQEYLVAQSQPRATAFEKGKALRVTIEVEEPVLKLTRRSTPSDA